jgi:hypothetical protein
MDATVILTADVGDVEDWTPEVYEAWTDFVCKRLPAMVPGVRIDVRPYGETESQHLGEDHMVAEEAMEALWEEWCATGWDAWLVKQSLNRVKNAQIENENVRERISGQYTVEQLERLTWPIAWNGTVSQDVRDANEQSLRDLVSGARQALEQDPDAIAVEICNGKVISTISESRK